MNITKLTNTTRKLTSAIWSKSKLLPLLICGLPISWASSLNAEPIAPGNWDRIRLYGHGNNNWDFSEQTYNQYMKTMTSHHNLLI